MPEIRVDCRVERQVRGHAVFHVAADGHVRFLREGVVGDPRCTLGDDVGKRLESARCFQIVQAVQGAQLRHEIRLGLAEHRPAHPFSVSINVPVDGEAERMRLLLAVAHLRERNAELGRPPQRVDRGGHVPYAVPGAVLVSTVVHRLVHLHAGRVHAELVTRPPVVIRVDEDPDHVGRREGVAPLEEPDDAVGVGIERPHEHVEIRRVVCDLRFGAKTRLLSFGGLPLLEPRYWRGSAPDRVVVLAVDHGRGVRADRGRAGIRRRTDAVGEGSGRPRINAGG